MKKKIVFLFYSLAFCFNAFTQNKVDNLIGVFLNSSEYGRVIGSFDDIGEVDFEKSTVIYIDNDQNKPEINIFFKKNRVVSAVIKSIPLKSSLSNILPGNEKYVMCLIDYKGYHSDTKTGEIKIIDLNYDNHIFGNIYLNNSELVNLVVTDIPENILSKYSGLLKKKEMGAGIAATHFCDLNQNGNVTFSECFTCMLRSCFNNQRCATLCGLTNLGGGIIGSVTSTCTASMAASCVYIAIMY